jgi:hypothetical protein
MPRSGNQELRRYPATQRGKSADVEEDLAPDIDLPACACVDTAFRAILPREHSMDLHNDPRFFASNVIEKRLTAFAGLSLIASLTTGAALEQCFRLSHDVNIKSGLNHRSVLEILGFFCMAAVLFMSLCSTIIFVYQTFFTNRLMTAGATGFELAANFYRHPDVVNWRHFGVKCLGYGFPLMMQSAGLLLYVDIAERDLPLTETIAGMKIKFHPFALSVLVLFTMGAGVLFYLAAVHNRLFDDQYKKRKMPETRQPFLA